MLKRQRDRERERDRDRERREREKLSFVFPTQQRPPVSAIKIGMKMLSARELTNRQSLKNLI